MPRPLLMAWLLPLMAAEAETTVEFNRDIRPILSDRCFYCHGPDEKTREADLRLDTREGALAVNGDGVAAIVPGQPEDSELLYRVTTDDRDDLMPPPKAKKPLLNKAEAALVRRWIEEGAEYQGHWAFEPLRETAVPTGVHPVDHFIDRRLAGEGIGPSPSADRHVLIRRLYLDLVGLLPTPEEVAEFVADGAPGAYGKLVDRLLASPHYGERWGRHWLDQARYADSDGYSIDGERAMWPYRDWVISALNADMPFDQFTVEQIAGDLLPDPTRRQIAATAFHRNTLINQEGGSDPEQFRVEATIDRVNTTGAVWLGLTLSCAQCHTHKFDPIEQAEFYQLFAFFNQAQDRNNTGPTIPVTAGEFLPAPAPAQDEAAAPAATGTPDWRPAEYKSSKTASGAGFRQLPGNSLLVDAAATANDAYQITATTDAARVAAVRLRVLPHESLPKGGPGRAGNGNFVLTGVKVLIDGKEQKLASAHADHSQPGYGVAGVIDSSRESGWAINVGRGQSAKMNAAHEAVFVLAKPAAGEEVEVRLFHDRNENYLIGRLALDFSPVAPAAPVPAKTAAKPVKLMVMRDGNPRDTYLLTRGDFTRPDKDRGKLSPGVIGAVAPALPESDKGRNRLDLARWLIAADNPLTPRVTVNRIWMRYFGRGIVETEEDFGTQGSPPSHPELLDHLASRFIAGGWSMKKLHRLIVTSGTYRRSSKARPDLDGKDPRNMLLARQSRIRLDAEIIRDAALSASGLLNPAIGGPGVRPPQPDGIYAFTQRGKNWATSRGAERFRRAMYTVFYRSAPHPLFGTFDAPDFQTSCTRRPRSNTPLQALMVANDEAFLEFAQGLAARLIEEVPGAFAATLGGRIERAAMLALSRRPDKSEQEILAEYGQAVVAEFATDPFTAKTLMTPRLAATGTPVHEAAAMVAIARALLNTDNFITRE